jgi:hypothetical protein
MPYVIQRASELSSRIGVALIATAFTVDMESSYKIACVFLGFVLAGVPDERLKAFLGR